MSSVDLARSLNPQQLEAVTHGEGPQLVLAGAGSGKTRVITRRVAWLIDEQGVDPSTIVAVTFTNKAAGEMRERVEKLLDRYPLPTFVGTFHRFALSLLRRYGARVQVPSDFVIFDADDQLALIKKALKEEQLSESSFPPRAVRSAISSAKNQLLSPEAFSDQASNFFDQRIARVYTTYQKMIKQASGVDFDDMLRFAVQLLSEEDLRRVVRERTHYLLVDEFQDTNHAQMRMILETIGAEGNLTAVGDEDQGIYRWRGADLDNVLHFERNFPNAVVRKLERNYRSTQNVLNAAASLVAHNRNRRDKRLWTEADPGEPLELYRAADEGDEARWIVNALSGLQRAHSLNEMAVLVRTNAQTRALEEELLRRQIPYLLIGGVRFYQRAEVKDLVAYLRVLRNSRDNYSLLRILNQPPRGIGKNTRQQLEEVAARLGLPIWDVLLHEELGDFAPRARKALLLFRDLMKKLQGLAETLPLPALLEQLLKATGYADLYDKPDPEAENRLENIGEFLSAAQEFGEEPPSGSAATGDNPLTAFLDHIALVSDVDALQSGRGVSLMTLHSAKGLEFPVVVVAGLEEGLLPHFNASASEEGIEEERRLLYVGMTRAEQRLLLTCCSRRRIAGRYQDQLQSPFLAEIPAENLVCTESPDLFRSPRTRSIHSFFNRQDEPSFDTVDEEGSPDGEAKRGRRVRHPKLGSGVILDLEGAGDNMKITVFFDQCGKRKLVAKFAGLQLL